MKRWFTSALAVSPAVLTVLMCGFFIHNINVQDAARELTRTTTEAVLNAHAAVSAAQNIREDRKGDYTDLSASWFRGSAIGWDPIVPFSGPGYPNVGSFKKFGMHASHVPSVACVPFVLAASAAFDDVYVGGTSSLDRGQSVFYDGNFLDFDKLDAACHAAAFVDIDLITH
ncbi:MAG: hypothetical protein RSP_17520 [Rhodanobacter sp.]